MQASTSKGRVSVMRMLLVLVALALAVVSLPIPALAEDAISYVERSWDGEKVVSESKSVTEYTTIGKNTTSMSEGWYVVKPGTKIEVLERIRIYGTVNLVICDNSTLFARVGIGVNTGNTLNIYGQAEGTGVLFSGTKSYIKNGNAGIGGDEYADSGTIAIHGGKVFGNGGFYKKDEEVLVRVRAGAGIGGGSEQSGGTLTVYGGCVEAKGGTDNADYGAAGIGGGYYGEAGEVTVYGGTVQATGGIDCAGIGGGSEKSGGDLAVYGGTVLAMGGGQAAGIGGGNECESGGAVEVHGGTVKAMGGQHAAGIGGGYLGSGAKVTITGGTVEALGNDRGVGIGGGLNGQDDAIKLGEGVTLKGGTWTGNLSLLATGPVESYNGSRRLCMVASSTDATTGADVEMLRLYNPNSGEHFYTSSAGERDLLVEAGWRYEGDAWKASGLSFTPVYRLYNKNGGDHHYTVSSGERDLLILAGWNYEGIGWYSDDDKDVEVLRLYNPSAETGSHHFTTSSGERDLLVEAGWKDEGVAFYGVK